MLLEETRTAVAQTALTMFRWGLVQGTAGNVSARDPATGHVAITPSSRDYETITPEDIVVVTVDGERVDGRWRPSSETPMHTVCYRNRPDVMAVIHTHAPYATAFSMVHSELPVSMPEVIWGLGGSIRVLPYMTSGTDRIGVEALEIIGDRRGVILQNHGTLTIGDTLDRALHAAVTLEDTARIWMLALQVGKPYVLPPDEVRRLRAIAGYKD